MPSSPNSLPNGPCLLFVDGQPVRLRRTDGRPEQPHPLLHAYGTAPRTRRDARER